MVTALFLEFTTSRVLRKLHEYQKFLRVILNYSLIRKRSPFGALPSRILEVKLDGRVEKNAKS